MTEMVKINRKLASAIVDIIESESESEASIKVKSIVKFIKSKQYKQIQLKVQKYVLQNQQSSELSSDESDQEDEEK